MNLLRNLSIRNKLLLLATASVAVALLLACLAVLFNDVRLIRRLKAGQLESQARMLAFNCTGALTFNDSNAAKQLLASLAMEPSVEFASLQDTEGNVLATYNNGAGAAHSPPKTAEVGRRMTDSGHLEIRQRVSDQDEDVGTLFLRANTHDAKRQLIAHGKIVGVLMAFSLLAAIGLSLVLQKAISHPIHQLSEAAAAITKDKDYSVRVQHQSRNELGRLCGAFNRMLDEIQSSRNAIQEANDHLEQRVDERTQQLTDEIERRELVQADLVRAKESAEAANEAKSEFLANMSHEIRTPLNGVLGFADLLLKGADAGSEEVRQDYLATIKSSGEHLLTLLNDILDLSRIEAGQLAVERICCSPHELIAQVLSLLRAQAQTKGLDLSCQWTTEAPESIVTDPARFRQLLMNLVGNAIKFTSTGGVRIAARIDRPTRRLMVDVIDSGTGIPADKLEEIFSPFRQADNSVTRRFGGTGLGLAISRHIAEALGGELTVTSELAKGSTFTVSIDAGPLDRVAMLASPESDALKPKTSSNQATPDSLAGANVLLVEDGPTNRKLIRAILEQAQVVVATAENGQIGVRLASKQSFDLILMDMQMPVMDGYSATRKLREMGVTSPIIALTAHAMKGDEEKCRHAGCSGYLTKPIDPARLLSRLSKELAHCDGQIARARRFEKQPAVESSPTGATLVSRLPTDQPVFRELVEEFVEFLDQQIGDMQRALSDKDFDSLAAIAHSLKGTGGTAGFDAFTEPSRRIEKLAHEGNPEQIAVLIEQLSELAASIIIPEAKSAQAAAPA